MANEIAIEGLASLIDHTQLKPFATYTDIDKLCEEAKKYCFHAVCINPYYISYATKSGVKICSVIGFPLGAITKEAKATEACNAFLNGADEIDMVMNMGAFKSKRYKEVGDDILAVVRIKPTYSNKIVKVIIETCYLSKDEIVEACKLVNDAGADYIKTSTGFGTEGATIENVILLKETIDKMDSKLKIKASGGIDNLEKALVMRYAGASRLGTSKSVQIIEELKKKKDDEYFLLNKVTTDAAT